ncbi:TonB-dependent receptor [Henriciella sp. AS95]|uniref:TonB-dependent receptor n=1 Tax=Henriciella sp. AS95 TaxID=3135782 RepID=UPI00317DF2F4
MKQAILVATASTLVLGAAAQETQQDTVSRQDTVIVTGQKIDTALQDVAASVEVVTGEEIAREPISDLYDIVDRIPNVTTSYGDLGFTIRGIDQRGIGGSGRGQTLTVYVDDASLGNYTTFFGPLDAWDLGQVEVFRGPQSTNFGRNALAGAIYVRTQDPTYEDDLRVRIEAGEYNTFQLGVAGGGAIIDDTLAWRGAVQRRQSDGFIDNTYLGTDADATELTSARFKLLFEPTDDISILSTTSYTDNFAGEDGVNPASGFSREAQYDVPGSEGTKTWLQSVNATWQINENWEVQSITAFQTTDYTRIEDYDVTPLPVSSLERFGEDTSISQEFRLKYFGERLSGALGAYYTDASTDYTDSFSLPLTYVYPSLPIDNLVARESFIEFSAENYAVFFDGEYALTDEIDFLFGARYDNETQSNDAVADTQILGVLPPLPPQILALLESQTGVTRQVSETEYDAFLPKVGLRWQPDEDTTYAFVVQKAYRAGGSEISSLDGSLTYFDPEYLWNYELSSRHRLMNGRLQWNNNIYYADWTDQQVSVQVPNFPNFYTTANAGESTIYGFETDLSYTVSDALSVYGGLGYAHTEFDDFPDPNNPGQNLAGNSFPFAPEVTANAGLDYDTGRGVFGGIDVSYQAESYSDQDNIEANEVKARTLVNARLGYAFNENFRLSLNARNLLDEDYYTFLNRDPSGGFSRLGDPRVVTLRLDADF